MPYSTNVNVGHLLEDDWVTNEWRYSSRRLLNAGTITSNSFGTVSYPVSGTKYDTNLSPYDATDDGAGNYSCPTVPADTKVTTYLKTNETNTFVLGPPPGNRNVRTYQRTSNGESYKVTLDGTICNTVKTTYSNYVDSYDWVTEPAYSGAGQWIYGNLYRDTSNWRSETNGCIEERQTYEITDYDNVDFMKALDLNLDLIPSENPAAIGVTIVETLDAATNVSLLDETLHSGVVTKWRPMYNNVIYGRAVKWDRSGDFQSAFKITGDDYISPRLLNTDTCPPASAKLAEMTSTQLNTYLSTLVADGNTYHDIGMIWGGRLISPTGLFASENADVAGSPTNRNLIFLTDGLTAPMDIGYSSYGFEPVDQRRWSQSSSLTLTETVEKRFGVACEEVRKRGVTVWVIGFGITLTDVMKDCAGDDRYFEAADAAELNTAFATIASKVSELRIVD